MASKKIFFLLRFGKGLLILFTVIAAGMLLFSYLAKIIHPTFSHAIAYCGLLFPYILLVNAVCVVLWLIIDYKWALLPVLCILINVNNIDKHFQLRAQDKPETCANCLKVMSFNARSFNIYEPNSRTLNDSVIRFLRQESPDILCIQEYSLDKSRKTGFHSTEEILKALGISDNNKTYRLYLPNKNFKDYQFGMAIFSKYRIINFGIVNTGDSSSNKSMYVDIRYNRDTLRIYNVHLSSMRLASEDYETGKAVMHNDHSDPELDSKAKKLTYKISRAFEQRQHQAIAVRADIDSCRFPIIICGDFNDSPAAYSVHKIGHGFKDSFRSSGKGIGSTYHGESFPAYRIDYIFHSNRYNDFGHTICTNLQASDHYPIYTYISIIDKK